MVSTVRPKANETPRRPIPTLGKAAASTALPQPPKTSQNVPRNSAAALLVSDIGVSPFEQPSNKVKLLQCTTEGPFIVRHTKRTSTAPTDDIIKSAGCNPPFAPTIAQLHKPPTKAPVMPSNIVAGTLIVCLTGRFNRATAPTTRPTINHDMKLIV